MIAMHPSATRPSRPERLRLEGASSPGSSVGMFGAVELVSVESESDAPIEFETLSVAPVLVVVR